jgi:SAM-dependent methyltransferase
MDHKTTLQNLFIDEINVVGNLIVRKTATEIIETNQKQTQDIFSDKWTDAEQYKDIDNLYQFQFEWFLKLYGFVSEDALKYYLTTKDTIIDTGCGLGYKAAWFARLAPHATVIGIDISDAALLAAKNLAHLPNLFFLKEDIAQTGLKHNSIDFTVCDQVIMHTEAPEKTFAHLSDVTQKGGEFACYVYRKKALPRELVDDYFRTQTHNISNEDMWAFSEQLGS